LSSRAKKAKENKKTEPVTRVKPVRPAGKPPEAMVTSRHGTELVTRQGRGYSMGELSGAGLSRKLASNWGLRLDPKRRSVVDGNVLSLKSWNSLPGATKKTEGVAKEIEEEIEKVGRGVKKEAIRVEKEAVRVEKEAKKVEHEVREEAVRAEKAVRRKPKPKKKKKS